MNYIGDPLKLMLDEMSHVHKYNAYIFENIKPYLGKKILEVGAGIGNISKLLLKYNPSLLILTDYESEYVNVLKQKYNGNMKVKVHQLNISKESFINNYEIDTIVCVNVLEHIREDKQALINCNKLLCNKGKLILFLPAIHFLYGELDKSLGHYRRYSKKEIIKKLQETGFNLIKLKYFNLIGILGWFINSRILKKDTIPIAHLKMFEVISFLLQIERYIYVPIGLSLIAIAEKKD